MGGIATYPPGQGATPPSESNIYQLLLPSDANVTAACFKYRGTLGAPSIVSLPLVTIVTVEVPTRSIFTLNPELTLDAAGNVAVAPLVTKNKVESSALEIVKFDVFTDVPQQLFSTFALSWDTVVERVLRLVWSAFVPTVVVKLSSADCDAFPFTVVVRLSSEA